MRFWTAKVSRRSAQVTEGMDVVDKINSRYGETSRNEWQGANRQNRGEGDAYLAKNFPDDRQDQEATYFPLRRRAADKQVAP